MLPKDNLLLAQPYEAQSNSQKSRLPLNQINSNSDLEGWDQQAQHYRLVPEQLEGGLESQEDPGAFLQRSR